MKFSEKLRQLTEGKNRSEIARECELSPTAITSYINKDTTVPRADIAVRIARVLKVPVEWLVDDSRDFPAPAVGVDLAAYATGELLTEVARRYLDVALEAKGVVEELYRADWLNICIRLCEASLDDDPPDDVARLAENYIAIAEFREIERRERGFNIVYRAAEILLSRGANSVNRHDITLSMLEQRVKDLPDEKGDLVRDASQLRHNWDEVRRNPESRESIENWRAQLLEKLKGLDRQSEPGHTGSTK